MVAAAGLGPGTCPVDHSMDAGSRSCDAAIARQKVDAALRQIADAPDADCQVFGPNGHPQTMPGDSRTCAAAREANFSPASAQVAALLKGR